MASAACSCGVLGARPRAAARGAPARRLLMRVRRAVHGERGEFERRACRALESGDARRLRFGLAPNVLIEEALLCERAAQLKRRRLERLTAQRGHLALEGLVGDERVLEQEQEQISARTGAREAKDCLRAGLHVD